MADHYPDTPQTVDPIEVRINHFFDRVVTCVNYRRMALLAKANEIRLEMAARVTRRQQKEQELLTTKLEIERNIKDNDLRELQERMVTGIEEKLSEVRLPHPETHLVFQGVSVELEQLILALGDVNEEVVPDTPRYKDMNRTVAVGKEGKNHGELWNPHGVAVDDSSNLIYIAEGVRGFGRVSQFTEKGYFLDSFTHERLECPWDVALYDDKVFVTDILVHGVFCFQRKQDTHLVAALVGEGSSDKKFNSPRQLDVSTTGYVFIADSNNHRVQILDQSLRYKRSITHKSMHSPQGLKLTQDEVYTISSEDSPCVHVFTYTGVKLRSIIKGGKGVRIIGACFLFLDAGKNIIISDVVGHCVKVFSSDGTLLRTMRQFQDSGDFMNPQGIALLRQKLVVVAPFDEFQLQIFSC